MSRTYECIESFDIDEIDEYGYPTEGFITIESGERFHCDLDDKGRMVANKDSIRLVNDGHWLEVSEDFLEEFFEEVEDENE